MLHRNNQNEASTATHLCSSNLCTLFSELLGELCSIDAQSTSEFPSRNPHNYTYTYKSSNYHQLIIISLILTWWAVEDIPPRTDTTHSLVVFSFWKMTIIFYDHISMKELRMEQAQDFIIPHLSKDNSRVHMQTAGWIKCVQEWQANGKFCTWKEVYFCSEITQISLQGSHHTCVTVGKWYSYPIFVENCSERSDRWQNHNIMHIPITQI